MPGGTLPPPVVAPPIKPECRMAQTGMGNASPGKLAASAWPTLRQRRPGRLRRWPRRGPGQHDIRPTQEEATLLVQKRRAIHRLEGGGVARLLHVMQHGRLHRHWHRWHWRHWWLHHRLGCRGCRRWHCMLQHWRTRLWLKNMLKVRMLPRLLSCSAAFISAWVVMELSGLWVLINGVSSSG